MARTKLSILVFLVLKSMHPPESLIAFLDAVLPLEILQVWTANLSLEAI
jgi:branched-subunit amino acid transport protein AzlD